MTSSTGVSQIVSFIIRRLLLSLDIVLAQLAATPFNLYAPIKLMFVNTIFMIINISLQKQMDKENGYNKLDSTYYGKSSERKGISYYTFQKTKVTESMGKHANTCIHRFIYILLTEAEIHVWTGTKFRNSPTKELSHPKISNFGMSLKF
jgi:hypothetical protein